MISPTLLQATCGIAPGAGHVAAPRCWCRGRRAGGCIGQGGEARGTPGSLHSIPARCWGEGPPLRGHRLLCVQGGQRQYLLWCQ